LFFLLSGLGKLYDLTRTVVERLGVWGLVPGDVVPAVPH